MQFKTIASFFTTCQVYYDLILFDSCQIDVIYLFFAADKGTNSINPTKRVVCQDRH